APRAGHGRGVPEDRRPDSGDGAADSAARMVVRRFGRTAMLSRFGNGILTDLVVYTGSDVVIKGLFYLLYFIGAAVLPKPEYGVLCLLITGQALLATVFDLGQSA